ncbi:hypothetical protein HDU78_009554 [Chytriomyces hyalinus]|nr:hypothetical protein HDU78_009554 [Chytriomyces hyalinus]
MDSLLVSHLHHTNTDSSRLSFSISSTDGQIVLESIASLEENKENKHDPNQLEGSNESGDRITGEDPEALVSRSLRHRLRMRLNKVGRWVLDVSPLHSHSRPHSPTNSASTPQTVSRPQSPVFGGFLRSQSPSHGSPSIKSMVESPKIIVDSISSMNIVIQIVGSRGDVQPFIALGKELVKHGHRVRIATHANFRDFVRESGQGVLEFYPLKGNPEELMAYMVKNPGLLPGMESIQSGDISKKRSMIREILESTYESCIMPDPEDPEAKPFTCDAIISNPPSFGHIHCAQKLGVPLHIFFTMPWSQTHAFPHPLTTIAHSTTPHPHMNYLSYDIVELMTWEGLRDIINQFRTNLGLPRLGTSTAVPYLRTLKVPHTYMWSQSLIPKPYDWGAHIDVCGFVFLDLATNYTPPQDLVDFLAASEEKPIYIGFGSIVVDDPDAMTRLVFDAVAKAGVRAIVSKGWGGLGADHLKVPENVYMIGNCPHDWLFPRVAGVVHHGGAGTTAAGLKAGKPTMIVPFFGDQPFWGSMVSSIHAGPTPIPYKKLNVDNFATGIRYMLKPEVQMAALDASKFMKTEEGAAAGVASFHNHIFSECTPCDVYPNQLARFLVVTKNLKVCPQAMEELISRGVIRREDVVKLVIKEWMPHSEKAHRNSFHA